MDFNNSVLVAPYHLAFRNEILQLIPVKKIAASLIQKGYFFQFWFFGSLILIYLCLPILKKILHSKRSYLYILSLLVVIGLIFELVNFFASNAGANLCYSNV